MAAFRVKVNGQSHDIDVLPDTPLLWVLRDTLKLTGTKFGCGIAQCGACTVFLDGQPLRSCSMPVSGVGASEVTTIEGLSGPEAAAAQFGMLLTLTGTTLKDVYDARAVIEPAAARQAAERASAAARKQLAAVVDQLRDSIDSPLAFGRLTTVFYQTVVELSGNKTLTAVVGMLTEIINRHIERAYTDTTRVPAEIVADHRRALRAYEKLVELINARDGDGAEKLWARHMHAVGQYLLPGADTRVVDLLY